MGEISFNYNVNTEPVQEAAFKYWFESIEYSFAYQRYIAFSDASIFNSPVAITKVATGLSQLYGLFADRKISCAVYVNMIKSLQESQSQTEKEDILFGELQKGNTNKYETPQINKVQSSNTNICTEDSGLQKDDPITNKNEDAILSKDNAIMHQDDILSSRKNVDTGTSYINLKHYWAAKSNLLNIYESLLSDRVNDAALSPYQQIFATMDRNKVNILKNIQGERVHDSTLNVYKILLGAPFRVVFNIMENISGKTFDNVLNVLQNASLSSFDNELNAFQNIGASPFRISMNILKMHFGSRDTLKMNPLRNILTEKTDVIKGNIIKQISGSLPNLLGNINPIISGSRPDNISNITHGVFGVNGHKSSIVQDFITGYQYGRITSCFDDIDFSHKSDKLGTFLNGVSTLKSVKEIMIPKDMLSIGNNFKHVFSTQQYTVHLYEKPLCYFDLDTFVVSERKYCFTLNGISVDKGPKIAQENSVTYHCFKSGKNIYTENNILLDANTKDMMTSSMIYTIKDGKLMDTDRHQVFVVNDGKLLHPANKLLPIGKTNHYVDTYLQYFVDKNSVNMDLFTFTSVNKFSSNINLYPHQDVISKDKFSAELYKNQHFGNRKEKQFLISDDTTFVHRGRYCLNMEQLDGLHIQKEKNGTSLQDGIAGVYRESYEISFFTDIWVNRTVYNMSLFEQYSVDKEECCVSIFRQGQTLIKKLTIVNVPDFDSVIKNSIPADYSNILTDSFSGMIIPLSKTKRQVYIDRINHMVQKVSKHGYIHQDSTASVIPRNTYIQTFDLFCDKKEFNLYVDYKNTQITRAKVQTFIGKNEFLKKTPVYIAVEGSIWADKKSYRIWSNEQLSVQKKAYRGFLDGIISVIGGNKDIYANESMFVDKKDQMCYYDYGMTWLDKSLINANIQSQLALDKKDREAQLFDCTSPIIRKELEGFYDYGVFTSRLIRESDLFKQIHDVHKKAYDTGIRPEDFGNWAWVYETPDPFDNGFGIDELLLPENDTRYEDFEDIIFDKENMVPRNPVKEINENTFIAKYPIRHPLPKYKDIGIDYEKSAIKLDQFYGIETSVMHAVFLKFYRIWQAKIFEFGTMTMVQSVKLMLEYLYAWILEYFPLEEVEQALRVFRLIRWYGETSIIQNSQYIVSYEYDTLESKLNTGTCLIPNDLDTQDTMYIDATLGVIRNNPVYINNGPAYVTFEINNRKNSTFTFSLSNTVGSVNIYINDVLVDTVSKSALNLTYELPYTGDTNVVKIEKLASHNLNGTFYIGNIKVPNCTFKELSIEFDPNLKAGNKPLNEIARKMISYANLYEDREAAYEIIRKGNLGVGEIYKHLTEYWKLHHQDKIKGKRLTIKEV